MQEQRDISSEEKQSGWEQEGKMSEQQPAREAEGTKPKKKPLVIVGIVIGVLLALAIGTGAIYARNTPERRLERQLELGEKYLEEMDYEQAVAAYRAALEIDPRCTEAYLGGIRACDGMGDGTGLEELYTDAMSSMQELEPEQLEAQLENVVQIVVYADKAYLGAPEKVVSALEKGHELTGGNDQVTDALVDGYLELAKSLQAAKDYDGELSVYNKLLELRPENNTALEQRKNRVEAYLGELIAAGELDKAGQLIEKYEETVPKEGFENYLEELIASGELDKAEAFIQKYRDVFQDVDFETYAEQVTDVREMLQVRETVMRELYGLMTAGEYVDCAELDGSEEADAVVTALEGQPCLYTEEGQVTDYTGKAVGLHPFGQGGYYFYYGDYVDGMQEGQGTYFISGSNYYQLYEGFWQGGKPNGSGTVTRYQRQSEEEEYGAYYIKEDKGTFRDGLYDGAFSVSIKDYSNNGLIFTGSYTVDNGSAPDVFDQYKEFFYGYDELWETHQAGENIYVILENPDTSWVWWSHMEPDSKLCINGFEE